MFLNIDLSKKPTKPKISLHAPNKQKIGNLREAYNSELVLKMVGFNELRFQIPLKYDRNHKLVTNKNVKKIKNRYLIKLTLGQYSEWFLIKPPSKNSDDNSEFIEVVAKSLEIELQDKKIRDYQEESKSILQASNVALENTGWTLGDFPDEYLTTYRSFSISVSTAYEFILKIGETFELVPLFDSHNRIVNFKNKDDIGENKGLKITNKKYLQTILENDNDQEFCTRLKMFGKDNLSIQRVNPTGQNYIDDLSYFLFPFQQDEQGNVIESSLYLSDDLCKAEITYQNLLSTKKGEFDTLLSEKETLESTLITKQNELYTLKNELLVIEDSLELAEENNEDTTQLETDKSNKQTEIDTKKSEIAQVESDLSTKNNEISTLRDTVSLQNNFTGIQLTERNQFIVEDIWSDDSYVDENDLFTEGINKLNKKKYPSTKVEMNIVNFLEVLDAQKDWDKIVIGDIISAQHDSLNINIKTQLIEASFNFDNSDINIVVSDNKQVMSDAQIIMNKLGKSETIADTIDVNKPNWQNVYNGTKNTILNGNPIENPSIVTDATAIDHTSNTDGSVDISFEWQFTESIISPISGFGVVVHVTSSHFPHTPDISRDPVFYVDKSSRSFVLNGVPSNKYYTFGVFAFRTVDTFINENGIIRSSTVTPSLTSENPYLPSTNVAFKGDIQGTIDGQVVDRDKITYWDSIESKSNSYTDTEIQTITTDLQEQIDGKVDTWFYSHSPTLSNEPAVNWTTEPDKEKHLGDLFYDTSNDYSYRFKYDSINLVYLWEQLQDSDIQQALSNAANAQDTADNKRRVFVNQPTTPYDIGDLWSQGSSGDLMICIVSKISGQSYSLSDWDLASKYTDDSALNDFVSNTYNSDMSEFQNQIDGKIESFFTSTDPSGNWTTSTDKEKHNGDMWYNTSTKKLYRYVYNSTDGSGSWGLVEDQKAIDAFNSASTAQDTADSKRRVFIAQPTVPYDAGDLWSKSNGDLMKCIISKTASELFASADWEKASDVTGNNTSDNTNNVGNKTASEVQNATVNFNNRNDRISVVPANPIIATDGTEVDHSAQNTDGTVDISFEWSFSGSTDAYNIDGFIVYIYSSNTSDSYTFGTTPTLESFQFVSSDKRAMIFQSMSSDKYYTFGVQSYRIVDEDISSNGRLLSSIVSTTPYQPLSEVAFKGNIVGTIGGTPYDEINKSPSTVIVSSEGSSLNYKQADYIVYSGSTEAQLTINQAINSLPSIGGKVILLDGVYRINSEILLNNNITLEGQGTATVIMPQTSGTSQYRAIKEPSDNGYTKNIAVKNLLVDLSDLTYDSIMDVIDFQYVNDSIIENVKIVGNTNYTADGVSMWTCNNISIINTEILYCSNGIHAWNTVRSRFTNNTIKKCTLNGIYVEPLNAYGACGDHIISNNTIIDNVGHGIYIDGYEGSLSDPDTTSLNNSINSNYIVGNDGSGIRLEFTLNSTFTGNTLHGNYYGIHLQDSDGNTFSGNSIQDNGYHGVYLWRSDSNTLVSNTTIGNSQSAHNTYDNIYLSTSCQDNNIQGNVCRVGNSTNKPRYAINLADIYVDDTLVTNNDLKMGGYSGGLNDAATGTVTIAGNRS